MADNFKYIFLLMIATLALSSCSKKLNYFTTQLKQEYNLGENDLKRIQFYLSEDITLIRSRRGGSSNIKDGKIQVRDKSKVEEIKFKKGTPGTAVFSPRADRVAVSFESGPDKYLMFGPNAKAKGRFVLLAKDWDRNVGQISYDGKVYTTSSESAYAALLVQIKGSGDLEYNSRSADGRKVRSRN